MLIDVVHSTSFHELAAGSLDWVWTNFVLLELRSGFHSGEIMARADEHNVLTPAVGVETITFLVLLDDFYGSVFVNANLTDSVDQKFYFLIFFVDVESGTLFRDSVNVLHGVKIVSTLAVNEELMSVTLNIHVV